MNKIALFCTVAGLSLVLAACGAIGPKPSPTSPPVDTSAPAAPPSSTPDPCTKDSLPETVKPLNAYMLQFDDKATVASSAAQADLGPIVSDMQTIRKSAGDLAAPSCLSDLKRFQLLYMDTVIRTLQGFQTNPQVSVLASGILEARQYHDQYVTELARLAGLALPPSATAGPQATPGPTVTATALVWTVTNPGPNPLNTHVSPSLTAETIAVLNAGDSATALGKSANGEWIEIELPGQTGQLAWVYASLISFTSGNMDSLPIVAP